VKDITMSNDGIRLTPEQKKRQRARSIAIAAVLVALVVLFYVVTIVKMGPGVITNRPL
jgi:cell division septal protein FtsQ